MAVEWTGYEGAVNVTQGTVIEDDRVFDVRDAKWGHPELQDSWAAGGAFSVAPLYDPTKTMEEKKALADVIVAGMLEAFAGAANPEDDPCEITSYIAPGCPEEPEAEVEVLVYRPKTLKAKKARCMYFMMAGGLVMREPATFSISMFATRYNCVCVVPKYRESYKAPYPAAINDAHAGYIWMLEHAEELQINPDNVVVYGHSSGGHLSLALGFRLKRYGITPKGVAAVMPQTDDRETNSLSNRIYNGFWDAVDQHDAMLQYAGIQNFGSTRLGPEYLANHATIEDCVGYPPTMIFTVEFDPDRANCTALYDKLSEAKTYVQFVSWPGAHHVSSHTFGACIDGPSNPYSEVLGVMLEKNINDFFTYDLRRPWVVDEAK